jgi:alpha-mannosidase
MLKLSFPTPFAGARYVGQVAYGHGPMLDNGDECVNQKWAAVMDDKANAAFTVVDNGLYGSDYKDGELRISLLRAAAYSCHPIGERPLIRDDRFIPRIDQGEREFRFWLNAGTIDDRMRSIDREALTHNEKPFAISFAPPGVGSIPAPLATLSDDCVQLTAFKRAENNAQAFIIRLFEPSGMKRNTTLTIPSLGIRQKIAMKPFEVKTLCVDVKARTVTETSLLER